ncbi:MAG: hypothetical protein A4E49_02195 [Methanosaeta sp. PtaU1.Bin112]|nr:MAG: hypothetical protein A4E49_02195 [Methanosaeta sp. PtaU1.Bin112]
MITITVREKDLKELARTEVGNLPGVLFAGASPLLRPFMKKLEALLPAENRGRGDSYILNAIRSHIDQVHADEMQIAVKSGQEQAAILREELCQLMGGRYPTTSHHLLNLPGLLFLQSSPSLQTASVILLRREHELRIPDGRRTMRYIFHMGVAAIDADKESICIKFDPERLPKREDGTSVLA